MAVRRGHEFGQLAVLESLLGIPPWNGNPLIATMGAASLATIFTTPPTMTKGDPDFADGVSRSLRFRQDAPKIYAKGSFAIDGKTVDYKESAWEFMTPPDADDPKLEKLRASGHKIILYHGQSDGVFSFEASVELDRETRRDSGGDAGGFARLFAVPGMNHCAHGPTTDNFDMLSAIVDWVEKGRAPDRVIAGITPGNKEIPADWSPNRTRPLCPWPKVRALSRRRQGEGRELRVPMKPTRKSIVFRGGLAMSDDADVSDFRLGRRAVITVAAALAVSAAGAPARAGDAVSSGSLSPPPIDLPKTDFVDEALVELEPRDGLGQSPSASGSYRDQGRHVRGAEDQGDRPSRRGGPTAPQEDGAWVLECAP